LIQQILVLEHFMTVTFYGRITEYTKGDKTYTPASKEHKHSKLRGLIDELCSFYGEDFKTFINGNETCLILINGNGIALSGGLDSPVGPGDKVDILPFVDAG